MKFADTIDHIAQALPKYRQLIFKMIVTGLVVGNESKTISAIFRQYSCLLTGTALTLKRFYLFLGSEKIKWPRIWKLVAELLAEYVLVAGRLLVGLDDTNYGKTGKKISGCAVHFDHAAKLNVSKWIFGHCRVVAGLLVPCHGRWACLPMAQQNFIPKKEKKPKLHARLTKKTRDFRKKQRQEIWERCKLGIAVRLVNRLRKLFNAPTLVVCDSWFGVHSLLKALRQDKQLKEIHILSRLRINCALFSEPTQHVGRGRPRKYGERLASVSELASAGERRTEKIFIYGQERDCTHSELICVSRAFQQTVKIVFIQMKNDRFFPLITTDLTLTARQMIEWYSARWKIESGFKELKHEVGALDSQARKKNSVENHFNLCCLAMTLTWVYALKQNKAPNRRHPNNRTTNFAFADVRRQIQKELASPNLFQGSCPKVVKTAIKRLREIVFGQAA